MLQIELPQIQQEPDRKLETLPDGQTHGDANGQPVRQLKLTIREEPQLL